MKRPTLTGVHRGIYLLNTLTKLFEGLMEARLSKFTEFNDTRFIDFATAYPSVHRERLGLTLKNYKITGKTWHLLKENS